MAKDPAFLFYSGDFLTGVTGMDMEERGQYITLLCLQHAKGHLSIDLINRSVPNVSRFVLEKFVQDDEGLYFNIRLEEEAVKRNKFCKSRSENRKSKKDKNNICETHVEHMENENENVIKDRNTIKNIIPTLEEFLQYADMSPDFKYPLTAKYEQWVAEGWKDGHGKKIKNWKTKLKNTIPYLRPFKQSEPEKINYLT